MVLWRGSPNQQRAPPSIATRTFNVWHNTVYHDHHFKAGKVLRVFSTYSINIHRGCFHECYWEDTTIYMSWIFHYFLYSLMEENLISSRTIPLGNEGKFSSVSAEWDFYKSSDCTSDIHFKLIKVGSPSLNLNSDVQCERHLGFSSVMLCDALSSVKNYLKRFNFDSSNTMKSPLCLLVPKVPTWYCSQSCKTAKVLTGLDYNCTKTIAYYQKQF